MLVRNFLLYFLVVLLELFHLQKVCSNKIKIVKLIIFFLVDLDNIIEHLNDLFRIVHSTNFKTSVRALQLLFRLAEQRYIFYFYDLIYFCILN